MNLEDLEVKLLQPDFDVEKFASGLLQSGVDISKYVNELSVAEDELNVKLEDHVSAHHNDLLSQATSVERLEGHLTSVSDQSVSLLHSVDKIASRIYEPYETMKSQTETLMRIVLDRPANSYDAFELISADVKMNPLNPDPEKGKPVPPSEDEVRASLSKRAWTEPVRDEGTLLLALLSVLFCDDSR